MAIVGDVVLVVDLLSFSFGHHFSNSYIKIYTMANSYLYMLKTNLAN